MSKFDPRRDPPYYAVIARSAAKGTDIGQFLDAGERLIGMAAAEPGFLGIEEAVAPDGTPYTVCYWDRPTALRRWRQDIVNHIPPKVDPDALVCFEGCMWHWLDDIFDAIARVDRENVQVVDFGNRAA
jgi:hypothetical protein